MPDAPMKSYVGKSDKKKINVKAPAPKAKAAVKKAAAKKAPRK